MKSSFFFALGAIFAVAFCFTCAIADDETSKAKGGGMVQWDPPGYGIGIEYPTVYTPDARFAFMTDAIRVFRFRNGGWQMDGELVPSKGKQAVVPSSPDKPETFDVESLSVETKGDELGGKVFTGKLTGKNSSQYQMQVVVSALVKSNGGRGECLLVAWRKDSSPLGAFYASVHDYLGSDTRVPQDSATAIVPPGGRWEAYGTETSSSVEFRVWAMQLK